ncbi:hypothetical protein SISNIDRAFT_115690 [Sistotremastrum niveocremeum HHB9708]|uniref:Dickkopf N-terminal cysteine-rich domain-containing protein n=2 Tax=Sistotremastraceae TaxID=3402574 RepID=A0A164TMM0_9AGAM|nr:hypothetical protein SISNIDRAFT_115690 [Sistotremastrum niveocremeum HHB9708]KZT42162.1 hypothetical protein SISSUDRAFT_109809 [Sistotremastrum suecicum HHB10207 ss-3]
MLWLLGFSFALQACAGTVGQGGNCSTVHTRLNPITHALMSDCDAQTFCSPTLQQCVPRLCRRDSWPFGYPDGVTIPPLCATGNYCPDEEDACKPLIPVGSPCQMNRDDECAPGPNTATYASSQNFNGSICLRSTCFYANVTLGLPCIIDTTVYSGSGPNGERLTSNVTRDNCVKPGSYCDPSNTTCQMTKPTGASCSMDSECQSDDCGNNNVCDTAPGEPVMIPTWQYVLTTLAIVTADLCVVGILLMIHRRIRLHKWTEMQDYYREQTRYRQSIISLHGGAIPETAQSFEKF